MYFQAAWKRGPSPRLVVSGKAFQETTYTMSPGRRGESKARGIGASARPEGVSMANVKDVSDDLI